MQNSNDDDAVRREVRTSAEFVIGAPRYYKRVAVLLAAALFGVIPLMSRLSLTVLLVGVCATYAADMLDFRRATVLTLLLTVLLVALSLFLSNLGSAVRYIGPMLLLLDLAAVVVAVVLSALLHFRWLQASFPELICVLERLSIAVTPVLALPSLLATIVALTGSRYAAFWLLLALCVEHYAFFTPLQSSFLVQRRVTTVTAAAATAAAGDDVQPVSPLPHDAGPATKTEEGPTLKARRETEAPAGRDTLATSAAYSTAGAEDVTVVAQQLNERFEAIVFTVVLLVLPTVVYTTIQGNWIDAVFTNLVNSIGLVSGALTYLCFDPERTLWFVAPVRQGGSSAAMSWLGYDPAALKATMDKIRHIILGLSGIVCVHWGAYRIMNCRYAYLLNGVSYPMNIVVLLFGMYGFLASAFAIKILLEASARSEDTSDTKHMALRTVAVLAGLLCVTCISVLGSTPFLFMLLSYNSLFQLNLFLMRGGDGHNMTIFTICSSTQMLWWMYRSFSFIQEQLHVFGEATTVPTTVVATSVLFCYVLGCISFALALSRYKALQVMVMFVYALNLTWIEHVLYAQPEDGVYPGVLVFATSAVGVVVASRLYKNGVLSVTQAALVASCYLAKLYSFAVEVTSAYYYNDLANGAGAAQAAVVLPTTPISLPQDRGMPLPSTAPPTTLLLIEISGGWWAALAAAYIVTLFEMERRKRLAVSYAYRLFFAYLVAAAVMAGLSVRNVQRAAYELITRHYVGSEDLPHIALPTAMLTFAALTLPFFARHKEKYLFLYYFVSVSRGVGLLGAVLLAAQPTRTRAAEEGAYDYVGQAVRLERFAGLIGLLALVAGCTLPLRKLYLPLRALYWLFAALALSVSMTANLLPTPSVPLWACVSGYVFLLLLLIDMAHYRVLVWAESVIVYGLSICALLSSFAVLRRIDLLDVARGNVGIVWEIQQHARLRLIMIFSMSNLFLAILLKCRLAGRPLLPHCVRLTESTMSQIGVMCNYTTLVAVCMLYLMNAWYNDNEPALNAVLSLLLLLLADDDVLFTGLYRDNFRYFPTVLTACVTLWLGLLSNSWTVRLSLAQGVRSTLFAALYTLPVLPAQLSLLRYLWRGSKRAAVSLPGLLTTIALSALVLLTTSRKPAQWLAIVAICGQCGRLFGDQMHNLKQGVETL